MSDLSTRPVQSLQSSSPLDTLVRRTSSRRVKRTPDAIDTSDQFKPSFNNPFEESQPRRRQPRPPSSPLLHTQFRSSTGTHSSFNTTLDIFNLSHSRDESRDVFYDDASVYSNGSPSRGNKMLRTPPDSPNYYGSHVPPDGPMYPGDPGQDHDDFPTAARPRRSSEIDPFMFRIDKREPMPTAVPQVVISAEASDHGHDYASRPSLSLSPHSSNYPSPTIPSGRTPSAVPRGFNYSRPNRPSVLGTEDEKRKVLERNAHRKVSPQSPANSQLWSPSPSAAPSPRSRSAEPGQDSRTSARSPAPLSPHAIPRSPSETQYTPVSVSSLVLPSPSPSISRSSSPHSPHSPTPSLSRSRSESPMLPNSAATTSAFVSLRREPPPIPSSPASSVYSSYSFYQLDNPSNSNDTLQVPGGVPSAWQPTASTSRPQNASAPSLTTPTPTASHNLSPSSKSPSSRNRVPSPSPLATGPTTSDDYLQLGIQHHEANRLEESAACFERSARMDGGSGFGMLMWGLALRHGWGCTADGKQGFAWLRRAAEAAVGDLEGLRTRMGMVGEDRVGGGEKSAVKTELVLAIYEVGQCFFQGWGVEKDQKMAVSYFRVAARLGDADAQEELGFCLANGRGCKKDRKEAAKWYRAAVAQGASDIGLAWIYKEKFQ